MLTAILVLLTLLFFVVGGIVGWIFANFYRNPSIPYLHPEMFDSEGNLIPDQILAIRFEDNYYDSENDSEED